MEQYLSPLGVGSKFLAESWRIVAEIHMQPVLARNRSTIASLAPHCASERPMERSPCGSKEGACLMQSVPARIVAKHSGYSRRVTALEVVAEPGDMNYHESLVFIL